MKNTFKIVVLLVAMAGLIVCCKKDQEETHTDIGYNYFPVKPGKYVIYNVDSIVMNSFTKKVDSFYFQIKEVIESVYTDNAGRPTLRLERYRKDSSKTLPYDQLKWVLKDVWSANRTNRAVEKVEENIRYVKLAFPVALNISWNGNAYNTLDEWDYKIKEVNMPRTVGKISFDSTLSVLQRDAEDLIDKKYYREMYAKNVGLIYKQIIDVHSDSINANPLMDRITKGIIKYTQTIKSFGG